MFYICFYVSFTVPYGAIIKPCHNPVNVSCSWQVSQIGMILRLGCSCANSVSGLGSDELYSNNVPQVLPLHLQLSHL